MHSGEEETQQVQNFSNDGMKPDGEIVGLHCSFNGRVCCPHDFCGKHLKCNGVGRFRVVAVYVNGHTETAIQVIKLWDGAESCVVGYLPFYMVKQHSYFQNKCAHH